MLIFDELLDIKRFRERKAETVVIQARGEMVLKHQEKDRAEMALATWREEAIERERALYADLCARVVRLRDIENVQQEETGFRHVENTREEALSLAEKQLVEAREQMERASSALVAANRNTEKFIELADDYAAELRSESERKEELEMEEAASVAQQREALEEWEARQDD